MRRVLRNAGNVAIGCAVGLSILLAAAPASAGPKIEISEDSWLQLSLLGQFNYSYMEDAVQETDFYLRRGRFILTGQLMDGVKVFVETDNDNAGKYGTSNVRTDIQDAFVDVRVLQFAGSEHWVEAGLILLPFSFETRSSAASLLGLDYNSENIKLVNSFVWRDYGAELHGNFGNRVAYCIGGFDGYDETGTPKNPDAELRATGHIALNLLGNVETGWFNSQNRLGKGGSYISIGAGFDTQDKATLVNEVVGGVTNLVAADNNAWVVDFQSGFNAGSNVTLTVNGAYYSWDNSAYDGDTMFVEAGVLLFRKVQPTFKWSMQDPNAEAGDDVTDYTVGLNYFMKGHNLRGGIEQRFGDSDDWTLVTLQVLL